MRKKASAIKTSFMSDIVKETLSIITHELCIILDHDPNYFAQEIRKELKQGFVSRNTAARILALITVNCYNGSWAEEITPYMLGVSLARAVSVKFGKSGSKKVFMQIRKGFMDKLEIKLDLEKLVRDAKKS